MTWIMTAVLVGMLAGGAEGDARRAPGPDFGPLEFLVGSCWVGTFPDGKQTDEHCFEWVFDRKFIRDRHVVRGATPYEGETLYAWDAKAKALQYWYWNSAGELVQGRVQYTPEGVVFPSVWHSPKGEVEIKAVWKRSGEDAYRVWNGRRDGAEWKTMWEMELRRR